MATSIRTQRSEPLEPMWLAKLTISPPNLESGVGLWLVTIIDQLATKEK